MKQPLEQAVELALKKKGILNDSVLKYLIRAALAAFSVGIGLMVSFRLGEGFFDSQSPVASIMSSIFFGIALILIIYGGAELFTGNTMYFTMATLKKATTVKDTLQNWLACYGGNLIGAVIFGLLVMYSGLFSSMENSELLMSSAAMKMSGSFSEPFFRGILCNIVVCLAVWIPMHVKGDGPKITVILLLVFAFVAAGFEHSVANMVTFSIALAAPHPETVTLMGALHNLVPVTLGNIIGGGFFVGAVYVFINSPSKKSKVKHLVLSKKRSGKTMYLHKYEDQVR
ncbi:formate/nitrite transporter family protein [Sporosarcina thermotolerans]|uniref:Formate/nitrite transporter family protein n=1 Tax=Sporosarcina thermotolerans TaxID=633404 RepID=A0AAW9A804_9BACL|nr:formate/nitrite transporter family protein [Sporosarcina thermotolerans]MDW0117766.1 formate/nitrite transporter family protein [Sporosarcina thermotolerans]WHT49150.1 formate/nitrite transporter family protein [Sporosarcina thermotolerans]